ncbi:hypothetical protein [Spirosoma koreense]
MNPERKLDQLEPLVAESLQKIDRLIEEQGQIVSEVARIPELERTVAITAKAVADLKVSTQRRFDGLTISTQRRFDEVNRRFADLTISSQ